jgi:outer membrane protein assembly factor BamB
MKRTALALTLIVTLLLLAVTGAPTVSSGASNNGVGTSNPALSPTELWNFTAANSTATTIKISWMSPAVAKGIVYIRNLEIYTIPGEPQCGFGPPQHTLQTIYALNASSGIKLWNFTEHPSVGSPIVIDGVAYFGAGDDVYALDAMSGAQIWVHNIGGGFGQSSLSVVDGVIYFSAIEPYHFYVSALSATNGDELWKYNTGSGDSVSPLAIIDDAIYFGAGKEFYALNAENGDRLWSYITDGTTVSFPTVIDAVMYFGADNKVIALSIASALSPSPNPNQNSSQQSLNAEFLNQLVIITSVIIVIVVLLAVMTVKKRKTWKINKSREQT